MFRFIAESNTGDQRAVDHDITNFLRQLIFASLLEICQISNASKSVRYTPYLNSQMIKIYGELSFYHRFGYGRTLRRAVEI